VAQSQEPEAFYSGSSPESDYLFLESETFQVVLTSLGSEISLDSDSSSFQPQSAPASFLFAAVAAESELVGRDTDTGDAIAGYILADSDIAVDKPDLSAVIAPASRDALAV
jgi:hypothetical protein